MSITMGRVKLAEHLDVSPSTVDDLVREGRLPPPRKIKNRILWLRSEVEAAVNDWPYRDNIQQEAEWEVH